MSVFFSSRKTILKSWLDTSSIASYLSSFLSFFLSQSLHHLDTWWIDRESFWPLDSFSTPGGSIKPHILLMVFLFLDSFSTHDLLTLFFSTPARQMSQHLICRDLLKALFKLLVRSACHFLDISLDWLLISLPNTLFSPSNLFYKVSSSFTKLFFTWYAFILLHFMHSCFWNLCFGIFFKKIWGFSKLMRYCWNFGLVLKIWS